MRLGRSIFVYSILVLSILEPSQASNQLEKKSPNVFMGCLQKMVTALVGVKQSKRPPTSLAGWNVKKVAVQEIGRNHPPFAPWNLVLAWKDSEAIVWDHRNPGLIMNRFSSPQKIVDAEYLPGTLIFLTATEKKIHVWSYYENPRQNFMQELTIDSIFEFTRQDRALKDLKLVSLKSHPAGVIQITLSDGRTRSLSLNR